MKSKLTATLLCFFLGVYGAHRFYIGDKKGGWIRLIVTIVTCFCAGFIWLWIDLIKLLMMSEEQFQATIVRDPEE